MENDKMILSAEAYGKKITIEIPVESNIHDFLDTCKTLAIGMTYHPKSWDDAIQQASDEVLCDS